MIYVWLVSKFRNAFSYIAHFDFFGKCFETNRILNVRVVSFYRKLFGLIPNALNLNRVIGRSLQTFIIFISLPIHVLGHLEVFKLSSSLHFSVSTICLQMYFQSNIFNPPPGNGAQGQFPADVRPSIPWDTHHFLSYNKYPTVFILLQNIARSV